jgi:pimeloyl-ACP methyl ester carboxylesterase
MTEPEIHSLSVPGAVLHYEVRRNTSSSLPVLFLIGSPMGARGFGTLAGHFADRTVVTYDPRGSERSVRDDDALQTSPDEHADDLLRLISGVDAGPVNVFASSGGAVNALVLVARHPERVRTLVAHEPPVAQVLPDRLEALAASQDIHATYERIGIGPAMAKFIVLVSHKGQVPADFAERPGPDPTDFGLPVEDDGSRNDSLVGQNLIPCTHYEHDFDALRAASTRVVIAAGAESQGELANRAAHVVAGLLSTSPVIFPGHHAGFLGGEYGMTGDPDAFAATLRSVLAG